MDIFIADANYRPSVPIEDYESLIWTERYASHGDFELTVKENNYFGLGQLRSSKFIVSSASNRVMMVENISVPRQKEGKNQIKITGRSIEAFLMNRSNVSRLTPNAEKVSGTPQQIANYIVDRYCVSPATAGSVNVIPGLSVGAVPAGTQVTMYLARGTIYDVVKAIADAHKMGFTIFRSEGGLSFYPYFGIDASNPNTSYYREFSVDAENLINLSSVESIAGYKNHARVTGTKASVDVYLPGVASSVSGFNRRTLSVSATDVGDETTTIAEDEAALRIRGQKALAEENNKYQFIVDGDIPPDSWNESFFGLGDIVQVQDMYGIKSKMMITESVRTADSRGYQYLPSFEAV